MIFVTGCARSGTSLITRMLSACGAKLGNSNGLAEHLQFKNAILKPYLSSIKADPMGQKPLPDTYNLRPYDGLREAVEEVAGGVEVIKDVKTALIWPLLHDAFPDAKWLIVYRHPDKIAESCMRTKFMRKINTHEEWRDWAEHYHGLCRDLSKVADTRTVVTSEVLNDTQVLRPVIEWLGFDFDADAVKSCINMDKWHGDKTAQGR